MALDVFIIKASTSPVAYSMMSSIPPAPHLILASASPRRKELLALLGYPFEVLAPHIDEVRQKNESVKDYVQRLALQKAQAALTQISIARAKNSIVIGSDTVVVQNGTLFEKPKDEQDAKRMLRLLSGKPHQVFTAVSVLNSEQSLTCLVETQVWFKALSEAEIEAYWLSGEPCDKSGSYGIQGLGGRFVTRIEGSYHAVMGLPLYETDTLLRQLMLQA